MGDINYTPQTAALARAKLYNLPRTIKPPPETPKPEEPVKKAKAKK